MSNPTIINMATLIVRLSFHPFKSEQEEIQQNKMSAQYVYVISSAELTISWYVMMDILVKSIACTRPT